MARTPKCRTGSHLFGSHWHLLRTAGYLEEHLAYLSQEIKHTEELIRQHINKHPGLKQQTELLDSIPGIAETTAALLLAEITDIKAVQKRPPGSGLCWISVQGASIGKQCQRAHPVIKARQCSTPACSLPGTSALAISVGFWRIWQEMYPNGQIPQG